jgi:hypothetical protein
MYYPMNRRECQQRGVLLIALVKIVTSHKTAAWQAPWINLFTEVVNEAIAYAVVHRL